MHHRKRRPPSRRSWRIPIVLLLGAWLGACSKAQTNAPGALDEATIARAGAIHVTTTGSPVTLLANSVDEGQSYQWRITAKPNGSASELSAKNKANPTFQPDRRGTYVVELVEIKDGKPKRRVVTPVEAEDKIDDNDDKFDHDHVTAACVQCHNGADVMGKPPTHLATTADCASCHSVKAWLPVVKVDHTVVIGSCEVCHNGTIATGKSATHVVTSAGCNTCHLTSGWLAVAVGGTGSNPPTTGGFDHVTAIGDCVDCHNGVVATGKSATHILTSDKCTNCHTTVWWPTYAVDHREVLGTCETCHAPIIPDTHRLVGVLGNCELCHAPGTPWIGALIALPTVANTQLHLPITQECAACHTESTKPASHPLTTNLCGACHDTSFWRPVGRMDHQQVAGTCVSCHNGTMARGKSLSHLATTDDCAACHLTSHWLPALPRVDHTQVLGTCVSCHNGVFASGKTPGHGMDTDDCARCHSTVTWLLPTGMGGPSSPAPAPAPPPPMSSTMPTTM